jgi:hypothetical protein
MKKWPQVWLRANGSDKYDASEWMFIIMSDARYRTLASELDAEVVHTVFVSFLLPSFVLMRWNSMSLGLSCLPPWRSRGCCQQFIVIVFFGYPSCWEAWNYRRVMVLVLLHRSILIQASIGMFVLGLGRHGHTVSVSSLCTPAWICQRIYQYNFSQG